MSNTPFGIKHTCSDCYATWYIRRKVAELIGKYGFTEDQEPDLVHELSVYLLCKWSQYDPSKSKPTTFIQRVIDSKVCGLIRVRSHPKRNYRRLLSLAEARGAEQYGLLDGVRGQPEVSDFDLIDLQSDVAEITAQLPEELKQIAELLKTMCPNAISRELGIPESTVRKRIGQLRQHFERAGYCHQLGWSSRESMGNGVNAVELLQELDQRGIQIQRRGDSIAYAPRRKLTTELRQHLQQLKPDILQLLSNETELPAAQSVPIAEPVANPTPPVSVVIENASVQAIEPLLVNLLSQQPVEIVITGTTNRRLRKILKRYRQRNVRFAKCPLDAEHNLVCFVSPNTLLGPNWLRFATEKINEGGVGAVYSDHELVSTGAKTNYPDELSASGLSRSGIAAPTILVRREALSAVNYQGEPLDILLRQSVLSAALSRPGNDQTVRGTLRENSSLAEIS